MITLKCGGDLHSVICPKQKPWVVTHKYVISLVGCGRPGYEWWMRLQIANGRGYNVVSIPLLINLYPSSLCFRSPGRSCRWRCLLESQSCWPVLCWHCAVEKLQCKYCLSQYYDFSCAVWTNISNCKLKINSNQCMYWNDYWFLRICFWNV